MNFRRIEQSETANAKLKVISLMCNKRSVCTGCTFDYADKSMCKFLSYMDTTPDEWEKVDYDEAPELYGSSYEFRILLDG
jgi:hypothetical protein